MQVATLKVTPGDFPVKLFELSEEDRTELCAVIERLVAESGEGPFYGERAQRLIAMCEREVETGCGMAGVEAAVRVFSEDPRTDYEEVDDDYEGVDDDYEGVDDGDQD